MGTGEDLDRAVWVALGDRLRGLNPEKYERVTQLVTAIVEGEEVLARSPLPDGHSLLLGPRAAA